MKGIKYFLTFVLIINLSLYSQIKLSDKININNKSSVSNAQIEAVENLHNKIPDLRVAWNKFNPTPTFLTGKLTNNDYIKSFPSPESASKNFLEENRTIFNLVSPSNELKLHKSETDNIGMTHVKLQQYYNDLKIIGSQIIVHFNQQGAISSVNGSYIPTPEISTTPSINEEKSKLLASKCCDGVQATNLELSIYIKDNQPTLVYEVQVPTKFAPKQKVIVDAQSGNVLYKDTGIRYDGPDTGSGAGLNGENRTLNIYLSQGKYYLLDATKSMYVPPVSNEEGVIETYTAHNSTNESNPYDMTEIVYDSDNDKIFTDAAAVDAHYFTEKVYEYYNTKFGRNSWDNNGSSLTNVVHYSNEYNNAFWNGAFMSYGDGDGNMFSNLAGAYDVIVHEITHGITQSTAGLEYQGQSGALNESYSDIMAAMADNNDWQIGEDVYTPSINGDALRDMSDPHQGGSTYGDPGWQPAEMNEYLYWPYTEEWDWGGVHVNSGIPNKAAYLVANQIGRVKTEQIYYRTLVHYLTPKSQFIDARNATLQATADLYGAGGTEYNSVASAFDNVGITSNITRTNELTYDDGNPETAVYESDPDWGIVNRLTTFGSGKLMTVEFYYGGDNSGANGSLNIKIYGDNGNKPGNLLFSSSTMTPSSGYENHWFPMSISSLNLIVNGNFYVGIFYDGTNQPLIGADTSNINGRAWEWDETNRQWIHLDENSYFPITLLMRAIVNTVTGVHQISNLVPREFKFSQNYPNPFNPTTKFNYALPEGRNVSIIIYDINGKKVAELVNDYQEKGTYEITWNGKNNFGEPVASGTYIYSIKAGEFKQSKKMLLLK